MTKDQELHVEMLYVENWPVPLIAAHVKVTEKQVREHVLLTGTKRPRSKRRSKF